MAEQKVFVCPNCGAKTTNTENCEHCGSLLVRFDEKGIDISESSYFDNTLVFPGLIDELKNNLRLQAEGKKAQTDIFWAEDDYSITVLNLCETSESESQSTPIQLSIELDFSQDINPESPDDYDANTKSEKELMKFTQLLSFPLFTSKLYKDEEFNLLHRYYTINCGQDADGTARLLSEILIKVMGLTPFDNYRIVTYYDEDDEYCEVSTYENDGQNINNTDNIDGPKNQAKVLEKTEEVKIEKVVEKKIDSEKFLAAVKDLVTQALANSAEIKSKAEKGDAVSCSQMGMIHLLGINTPIDFKKASQYFGNRALADDADANRMLGFIAEYEGDYSLAFKKYANAATGSKAKKPYINKVFSERNDFKAYLKKLGIPVSLLNEEITKVLDEYIKEDDNKLDASIKLALICDDVDSCLIAAQGLFDAGDYYSALQWLQKRNVPESNTLYASIKKKISDSKNAQNLPYILEVIEIEGNSFLCNTDAAPSYAGIRYICDEVAAQCKKEWIDIVSPKIAVIKKKVEDEEAARIKKQKDEEAARIRKQKEDEAARLRKLEEEKQQRLMQEDEEMKKKKKKRRRMIFLVYIPIAVFLFGMMIPSSKSSNPESPNAFTTGLGLVVMYYGTILMLYFYYFIFKVIYKAIKKVF